ncbi:hypothetical protein EV182_002626, partial [Spiromyces aspiralis]
MRNLTLLTQQTAKCPGYRLVLPESRDQPIVATPVCVNSGEQRLYGLFTSVEDDDEGLSLWSLPTSPRQPTEKNAWRKIADIAILPPDSQVAGFHYLGDDEVVFLATKAGDIIKVHIVGSPELGMDKEGLPDGVELIGSVDSGIQHACWSPDEE